MDRLLSIRTVYPRSGAKVWYDDQREVHAQVYGGSDTVDYAFMGANPDAADNRWLREAYEEGVPILYFLGTSPGRYQALLPTYVVGWNRAGLRASLAFGEALGIPREIASPSTEAALIARNPPETATERRYGLTLVKRPLQCKGLVPHRGARRLWRALRALAAARGAAARCRAHRGGWRRGPRPAGGAERRAALEDPPRRIRRPSDRDRPGLPAARVGPAHGAERRASAGGDQEPPGGRRSTCPGASGTAPTGTGWRSGSNSTQRRRERTRCGLQGSYEAIGSPLPTWRERIGVAAFPSVY